MYASLNNLDWIFWTFHSIENFWSKHEGSLNEYWFKIQNKIKKIKKILAKFLFNNFIPFYLVEARQTVYLQHFYCWFPFKEFWILAKYPRGGGLGVPKGSEQFFSGFLPLKVLQKFWNMEKFSNVYNIYRGQQYFNICCCVAFCKMSRFTHKKFSASAQNRGGGVSAYLGNAHI